MRLGSLFSGTGGLDMAVNYTIGTTTAWVSDIDPGARKLLAHRYPNVPNLGDITNVDWRSVEPVDVLIGGFPCQDVSHAGKRAGLHAGTRTGLWSHMAAAIEQLRPSLVVAENVRGLLSASATSDLEPCPWCVGNDVRGALRALGAVLGTLADIGYDASWYGLRAADVGAPHGRFRIFVVAWDAAVAARGGPEQQRVGTTVGPTAELGKPTSAGAVQDADVTAGGERRVAAPGQTAGRGPRADAGRRGGTPAADPGGQRHGGRENPRRVGHLDGEDESGARERERARAVAVGGGDTAATDTEGTGWAGNVSAQQNMEQDGPEPAHTSTQRGVAWGQYAPAVHRWEHVLGRPAPAPTEPGRNGGPRLSPTFVEWMMGLPPGWVTQVPGLSRNDQLKLLGNGVVPQQAIAALQVLLTPTAVAA